jgi:hypothetical protein
MAEKSDEKKTFGKNKRVLLKIASIMALFLKVKTLPYYDIEVADMNFSYRNRLKRGWNRDEERREFTRFYMNV